LPTFLFRQVCCDAQSKVLLRINWRVETVFLQLVFKSWPLFVNHARNRDVNRSPVPTKKASNLGIISFTNSRLPLKRLLASAISSDSLPDRSLLDKTTVGMPFEWSESIAFIASEMVFISIPVSILWIEANILIKIQFSK